MFLDGSRRRTMCVPAVQFKMMIHCTSIPCFFSWFGFGWLSIFASHHECECAEAGERLALRRSWFSVDTAAGGVLLMETGLPVFTPTSSISPPLNWEYLSSAGEDMAAHAHLHTSLRTQWWKRRKVREDRNIVLIAFFFLPFPAFVTIL